MSPLFLFNNRIFVLLFASSIFAVVGFSMFLTTTTWYVITDLGSAGTLGLVLIAATVPRILMMAFGGLLADKYKKTTIMFSTNLIQSILLLIIFILVSQDNMTLALLLILSGLFGMLDAFFGPASSSMIPKIVDRTLLQPANAVFQGVDQISFVIGPILAGFLMEQVSVSGSYLVTTGLVFLSAVLIFPPYIKESPVEKGTKQTPLQDLKVGFSYIRHSNFLLTGLLVLIILNFFVFGALHVAIPLLVDAYGGTPLNLSYMEVSLGIGLVVGTGFLSMIPIKRRGKTSLSGLVCALIAFIIFSWVPNLILLTVVVFFIGLSMSFVFVPFFTAAQETTDIHVMGRVMSLIFLAMNGFDPVAYALVSGLAAIQIPIQFILFGLGVIGLMITIVLFFTSKPYQQV
ncbi:MFS transporter [Virgibacillus salexigens]|uniref:MFS transporter n=1 Tax=Virgibacillus salexigens TaxID=61016 RepID=UPI00190956CD|nr:MFS transporter [Virgibacillus salexigens]